MKDLVRYLSHHPAVWVGGLAAIVLAGIGVWSLLTNLGLTGGSGTTKPFFDFELKGQGSAPLGSAFGTSTATPNFKQLPLATSTATPATLKLTVVGQYCQNGLSYTNLKVETSPAGSDVQILIDAFSEGSESFSDMHAMPDMDEQMTCFLVKSDPHSALFNCTGPENSTVTILVGGTPVDVPFMACEKSEKDTGDETCTGRDCR